MDTNALVNLLTQVMANKVAEPVVNNNALIITGLVLAALAPILAAFASWFSRTAAVNTEALKIPTAKTAGQVGEIYGLVNGERTALMLENSKLKGELFEQAKRTAFDEGVKAAKDAALKETKL